MSEHAYPDPNLLDDGTGLTDVDNIDITGHVDGQNGGIGGLVDIDAGGDGIGATHIGVDGDADALINVAEQAAESGETPDIGSLINAAMLDIGGTGVTDALALGDAYDGNVPLVGDLSSALEMTLDHLTASSSLFDVPVLDVLSLDALDS